MIRTGFWFGAAALLFLMLTACSAHAVPTAAPYGTYSEAPYSPTITVVESTPSVIRLHLTMENMPGGQIDLLDPPAGLWGEMNPNGSMLPRLTVLIALPPTGDPAVSIDSAVVDTFAAHPRIVTENDTQPPLAVLRDVGIWGGVRVVPLVIRPIWYQDSQDSCFVTTEAIIRIDIDGSEGTNPIVNPWTSYSREWQQAYRAAILNWEYIPNYHVSAPSHILMIVPDGSGAGQNFINQVQSFIRWKEQRGIYVTVVPRSSIGANPTATQVRNRIQSEMLSADPPIDNVILVGDEDRLPVYNTYTSDPVSRFSTESYSGSYTNENYFAALEGSDLFPDVFLGRWVVSTQNETSTIGAKCILHERDPFHDDSSRFEHAVVSADNTEQSQRQTVARVADELEVNGFAHVDSVYGGGGAQQMTNLVDDGQAFVNYRGSGWSFGWAGINFYVWDVEALANYHRLPIVTGIGCGTGIFNVADNSGFGERWMNLGSASSPKGALAFIGPCWNTHTVYNDCLDSLLYRAWLTYDVSSVGAGLAAAKMMEWGLMSQFITESGVLEIMNTLFRQYILQGDPSLQVFTDTPVRPMASIPDQIPAEPSDLTITISNPEELPADSIAVTVWLGRDNFTTAWIPAGGTSATIPVAPAPSDTAVFVTITGDNVLTIQKLVLVGTDAVTPAPQTGIPADLELAQNYPNPFNSSTQIEFGVPVSGQVILEIFDILGGKVATLVDQNMSAGRYHANWQGLGDGGQSVGSGVYFYRLVSPAGMLVRKLALVR